jgi:hypothetical protein
MWVKGMKEIALVSLNSQIQWNFFAHGRKADPDKLSGLQGSIPVSNERFSTESGFQPTFIVYRWYRRTFQSPVPERSKKQSRFNQRAIPSIRLWDHMRNAFIKHYPPKAAIAVF